MEQGAKRKAIKMPSNREFVVVKRLEQPPNYESLLSLSVR
ncbi:hypothetical protein MPTK1_6g19890 [Marchantia polymorpha subsp. ruderalis]|uniref:Uncharacterized protein n=2 Tax=Marchantia polymorpha TaxID=3197 RepID=A0AAF6BTZ1_MARPO|nr:hypothetical protein MARPO_0045s0074 [Marchantia polymorpha]BBN15475.1 hypothetical protein Mp_6g19890 [Marchantia polymorpha subsp. ruderalis]|eukprot:PTQ39413.1 hypothetical protein MARPO_0045s0074 [Marchantia polymorpha]